LYQPERTIEEQAYIKMKRAKIQLQKSNPFFAHITLSIREKPNPEVPTARIDIRGNMEYNPEWIADMPDDEVEGVLEHEGLHLTLEHLARRIDYHRKYKDLEVEIWAMAEDMIVNDIITSSKKPKPLPQGIVPVNHSFSFLVNGEEIKIEDINKKSVEMIFKEIMDKIPKTGGGGNQQQQQQSQPQQQGSNSGGGGNQQQQQQQPQQDQKQDGNGSKTDTESEKDKKEGSGSGSSQNPLQSVIDQLPKGFDEHERTDIGDKEVEKEIKRWRRKLVEAIERTKKARGDIPLGIERRCNELFKERLNWQHILRRYIQKGIKNQMAWNKKSRKTYTISSIMGVETHIPSRRYDTLNIVVSVDTSGSIYDKLLDRFVSEIVGISRSHKAVNMCVIVSDKKVQNVVDIKHANKERIIRDLKLKGGGGTSHVPVFKWIEENKKNTRLVVCLTDGHTKFPQRTPKVKTIWVLGGTHKTSKDHIPFGKVIEIPKEYGVDE